MLITNFAQCGFTGGRKNCFDMLDCFSQYKRRRSKRRKRRTRCTTVQSVNFNKSLDKSLGFHLFANEVLNILVYD